MTNFITEINVDGSVLSIDSTLGGLGLGIFAPGDRKLILQDSICSQEYSGSSISSVVQDLLARCKIGVSEIAGVLVSTGPGSFTGIRVGAAWAKGFGIGKFIGAFSGFEFAARQLQREVGGQVALVFGNTRGFAFVAVLDEFTCHLELVSTAEAWPHHFMQPPVVIENRFSDAMLDWIGRTSEGLVPETVGVDLALQWGLKWMTSLEISELAGLREEELTPRYMRKSTAEERERGIYK